MKFDNSFATHKKVTKHENRLLPRHENITLITNEKLAYTTKPSIGFSQIENLAIFIRKINEIEAQTETETSRKRPKRWVYHTHGRSYSMSIYLQSAFFRLLASREMYYYNYLIFLVVKIGQVRWHWNCEQSWLLIASITSDRWFETDFATAGWTLKKSNNLLLSVSNFVILM